MGLEDQQEERQVLDSIFPDEITDISDNAYRISITLDLPPNAPQTDEPVTILLNVSYPEAYPDVAPNLDITTPQNMVKYPLLDVGNDKAQLLDCLNATVEESLGMAMVFTLVSSLKEAAELLIADRVRQAQEVKDVAAREAEEIENRKFHGERVTREKFIEWREKFRKEMEEKERMQREQEEAEMKTKKGVKTEEKKLTGKQLWERGLVGKGDEDIDTDGIVEDTENLKVEG